MRSSVTASQENIIIFRNISKIYHLLGGNVTALDNVSGSVGRGEFIAIMGPSGSGKSTLLNILGCLDVPDSGEILINGIETTHMSDDDLTRLRRDHIGFIFQQFNLIPLLTARENVQYPLLLKTGTTNCDDRCIDVLRSVALESHLDSHKPNELSGGQQQRVAIARALVNDPEILLCDEPTGNLDSKTGNAIMELLKRLCEGQGKTIIMVTHDPSVAVYAHRKIQIVDGKITGGA